MHSRLAPITLATSLGAFATGACASAGLDTALTAADRPGYTFGTATVPLGGAQAELGYTDTRAAGTTYQTIGEGLLRVGAGARTEARLFANSYALRADGGVRTNGMEDLKLGIKQRLWAGHGSVGLSAASLALLPATSVPTGSDGFGAAAWQPELLLAGALPLSGALSLVTNVGDSYVRADGEREHKLVATLAAWLTLSPKLGTFAEYGGTRLASDARSALHYFDVGVALTPLPALQLDARVGQGANGVPNDRFLGVGVARRW